MTAQLDLVALYNEVADRLEAEGHPDAQQQAADAVELAEELSDKLDQEKQS